MSEEALMSELGNLVSEGRNPRTMQIDLQSTPEILKFINDEDKGVAHAVEKVLPEVAAAVDRIVDAFHKGGRLIYIGAGTSGRLGILDASECPPTFSVPESMVFGLIAGGEYAVTHATEGSEDDPEEGRQALMDVKLGARDVVVGIAVSGRTPYVIGALKYAKKVGAATVALSCNPGSAIGEIADIAIAPVVGPEILTGSTRLKSGTAQKLVLNMLSTASMIRMGKIYENLMVDVAISNQKLFVRAQRIVMEATGCDAEEAKNYLTVSGSDVKLAIMIAITGLEAQEARKALAEAGGFLRKAINERQHQAAGN